MRHSVCDHGALTRLAISPTQVGVAGLERKRGKESCDKLCEGVAVNQGREKGKKTDNRTPHLSDFELYCPALEETDGRKGKKKRKRGKLPRLTKPYDTLS